MKIYTGQGDEGKSDLIGGIRAQKHDVRFCALGDLDELSTALGLLKLSLSGSPEKDFITGIQKEIITLSANIAALGGDSEKYTYPPGFCDILEKQIDKHQSILPSTFTFTLPGANEPSARADFARTVARRAERSLVRTAESFNISTNALPFINRLSDYLYMLARVLEVMEA